MNKFKSLRGTYDVLPPKSQIWKDIEYKITDLMDRFGYSEIKIPVMEQTEVFTRSIGQETDIVNKEMYTFQHSSGKKISLRPEGTAGVVRAYIQHNLHKKEKFSKLYYIGPMFRKERPQSGRNREFYQFGVEYIGSDSAYVDAEIITILDVFFKEIKLDGYEIRINSLGCEKDKRKISNILKDKLMPFRNKLCKDCKRRIENNVFRVLDCKKKKCREICKNIPDISQLICEYCKNHYSEFKNILDRLGIKYIHDNTIVRGLDYYTGTVFEVVFPGIGSQNAIVAGGRYDNLINQMGGEDIKAIGFALGIERLLLCLKKNSEKFKKNKTDIFLVATGEKPYKDMFNLLYELRKNGIKADMDYTIPSVKAQMRRANKLGVKFVGLLGSEELRDNKVSIKNMDTGNQFQVERCDFVEQIGQLLIKKDRS